MSKSWEKAIIGINSTIQEAIENLNESCLQIILIVDETQSFVGTITDGDIRRGILKGLTIQSSIKSIIFREPLVVPPEMNKESVLHLMKANKIQRLPIIDSFKKVKGLHIYELIEEIKSLDNYFIVMAGGKGTRMRPFTEKCPKPMLLVKDKPILEHILLRAIANGFTNFIFCIHYLGDMIKDYFEDGTKWNVTISYVFENFPLGTAGALRLIPFEINKPILVTNGDVLTDINYSDLIEYNQLHDAWGTMAVRDYILQHPFGVVNTNGIYIENFEEKPSFKTLVNAGVYVIHQEAINLIKKNIFLDMPTLFTYINQSGNRIIAYPMHETWMDVGRPNDLELANRNH